MRAGAVELFLRRPYGRGMSDQTAVLARLRGGQLDSLVELALAHVEATPFVELIDPARVARALAASLDFLAGDAALEERLRVRAVAGLAELAGDDDPLPDRMPEELRRPLRDLAGCPWPLDADLTRALLDHDAVRGLTRHVLHDALLDFGRSVRSIVPERARRGRLGALVDAAHGVASAVGAEVERQLERRVRVFVDDAIGRTLDRAVGYVSRREAAEDLAAWRCHALDVLAEWATERRRAALDAALEAGAASDAADAIRAVAAWDGLEAWVEGQVRHALEAAGTLAEVLGDDPALRVLRDEAVAGWRDGARSFVETEAFEGWLRDLLGPAKRRRARRA